MFGKQGIFKSLFTISTSKFEYNVKSNLEEVPLDLSTLFNLYANLKFQKNKNEIKEVIDKIIEMKYNSQTLKYDIH